MNRRLAIYLAATFGVTWGAWGSLAALAPAGGGFVYGRWPFMTLFILGGFGPAIGAYVAVLATAARAPRGEFHRRLLRWRVAPWIYLAAAGLPAAIAAAATGIAVLLRPALATDLAIKPWIMIVPLFAMMIVGGGVEELGWRGVAQPEMARAIGPLPAALAVGAVWAIWHAPLFFIPGVSQYGGNFPRFAVGVVGAALILAWIYARGESILLCIVCHAAGNAATALGLAVPAGGGALTLLAPVLSVAIGAALLIADRALPRGMRATRRSEH
jgi:membrane protease YdiL (CAAX protease family)